MLFCLPHHFSDYVPVSNYSNQNQSLLLSYYQEILFEIYPVCLIELILVNYFKNLVVSPLFLPCLVLSEKRDIQKPNVYDPTCMASRAPKKLFIVSSGLNLFVCKRVKMPSIIVATSGSDGNKELIPENAIVPTVSLASRSSWQCRLFKSGSSRHDGFLHWISKTPTGVCHSPLTGHSSFFAVSLNHHKMAPRKRTFKVAKERKARKTGQNVRRRPTPSETDDPKKRSKTILRAIYYDINCASFFRKIVQCTNDEQALQVYQEVCNDTAMFVAAVVASFIHIRPSSINSTSLDQQMHRGAAFIGDFGWKLFAICAFTEAFRRACKQENAESWRELTQTISDNSRSIEIFACVRGLEWRGPLLKHTKHELPNLRQALDPQFNLTNEHPHLIIHSLDGQLRRPMLNGKLQSNIDHYIFDASKWEGQADPTFRKKEDGKCDLCHKETTCKCRLDTLAGHLVELVEYPNKGTGVRALTNFKEKDILGQYVGEILPEIDCADTVYPLQHVSKTDPSFGLAIISPRYKGNWTRFINHSCSPSTKYVPMTIGERTVMVVQAIRDISAFEEITANYGWSYWTSGWRTCRCGEPNCLSNQPLWW